MTDAQPSNQSTARELPTGVPHPQLDELIAVLELLRAPGGCAWDAEQTHESLVRYLIEETYELIDAIESGNRDEMIEELGDVLYQVVFHSDIAAHTPGEEFTLEDVAAHMTAKMVGRHPHVFGDAVADTASEVNQRWDEIKKVEKPARTSVLDGVPQAMPSLLLADKLLGKAEKLGVGASPARTSNRATSAGRPGMGHDSTGQGGEGKDSADSSPSADQHSADQHIADQHSSDQDSVGQRTASQVTADQNSAISTRGAHRSDPVADIYADESALGAALLSTVSAARERGLDAERALRGALRDLQDRMREAESEHPTNSPT